MNARRRATTGEVGPIPPSVDGELERLRRELDSLGAGLKSNRLTGAAVGRLIERHQISAETAFAHLVRLSQHSNTKLVEVARRIVDGTEG